MSLIGVISPEIEGVNFRPVRKGSKIMRTTNRGGPGEKVGRETDRQTDRQTDREEREEIARHA